MIISIITLFPEMFTGIFDYSIIKRAQTDGHVKIRFINLRDFGTGKHKVVDDTPYGGGVGMVLKVDVLDKAIESAKIEGLSEKVVLLTPVGRTYHQRIAEDYALLDHIILVCGHYEGFDARISHFVDDEISIGDYVMSGGEIPAMVITESVTRLLPNVLKQTEAHRIESFSEEREGLLEHPQYTRPAEYKGLAVPDVLVSGHAAKIDDFRLNSARKLTKERRPDLLKK